MTSGAGARFETLSSGRLVLRRFEPRDAAAFAAYRADPEVARYQAWESCTFDEAQRFVASLEGLDPGKPGVWFQFAVSATQAGDLLGDCALRCTRGDPRQAELGFTFARSAQGKGFAAEAVRTLLGWAFPALGLHRVFAVVDARNRRAQRLLDALGFRHEGSFLENTWFKGAWSSEVLYAILAREWPAEAGRG